MSGAIRNFAVVFLLALLGFGIIGHYVSTVAIPSFVEGEEDVTSSEDLESSEDNDISADDNVSAEIPVEGNEYNFAFICTDVNNKLAGIYLVHVDEGLEISINISVPGSSNVENNGAITTLSQLYEDEGEKYLLKKLYYLTGCEINDHAYLCAVDNGGKGRDITQLSTYLKQTYKLTKDFKYPNPNFNRGDIGEDSGDEVSVDSEEYIVVEAGSYALNGKTEGVRNDLMLLDTRYNNNAFKIYSELLSGIVNDIALFGDSAKQAKILGYTLNKSFGDYASSEASEYLFNDYVKASISHSGTSGTWSDIRQDIKALEDKAR